MSNTSTLIRSVHLIITIRTARKAHSNCNIPRSINHKPTQAQKPRKANSKCNIPRSINHKPLLSTSCCRSFPSVRIDKWLIRTVTVRVYWTTLRSLEQATPLHAFCVSVSYQIHYLHPVEPPHKDWEMRVKSPL